MTDERIIKKYPNRRLYDTNQSCYITLNDVRDLVLASVPFKVIDRQSGDDITRSILLQIIIQTFLNLPPPENEPSLRLALPVKDQRLALNMVSLATMILSLVSHFGLLRMN